MCGFLSGLCSLLPLRGSDIQFTDQKLYCIFVFLQLINSTLLFYFINYRHVQCVLNFLPNNEEDGGTLIVPKFHKYLPIFCDTYAKILMKNLPWVQFPGEVEAKLLHYAHRIPMREVRGEYSL